MKMSAMCRSGNATVKRETAGIPAIWASGCHLRHYGSSAPSVRSAANRRALSGTSRFAARLRHAVAVVAARPDRLRRHADRLGQQLFQCGPLLLQSFAGRRWMVSVGNGQSRQVVPSLLEGREHVRRMPVSRFQRVALATVSRIHATFSPENYGRLDSSRVLKRGEGDLILAQKCRDFVWCTADVT